LKIFNSINDFHSQRKTILTLGTFDGVHIGHKKILEKLVLNSHETLHESLLLTFFPHPRMVLQEKSEIKLLNTIPEKIQLLEAIGIQSLVIHPFDEVFSRLTAEDFVTEILIKKLNIHKIVIGYDHRFGRNRTANIDNLIEFGEKYNFEVSQISAQEIDSISVSSTKIRNALTEGNVQLANEFLGYNYFITGQVTQGNQLGRTIGFPTANMMISENYKLIPKNGVYIVESEIDTHTYFGIMNIGYNPTVGGNQLKIEVHFFELNQDLYNKTLQISILKYIREEQKFDSIDELKNQINQDKSNALNYINSLN
jgi:riboflavin kinase / FMN adenylyltransferase